MDNKLNILEKELHQRIKWFIFLRWIAITGLFLAITKSYFILKVDLPLLPLYIGNVTLLVYNLIFYYGYKKNINNLIKKPNAFANFQISLDLITLTFLIYFSGDLENPFICFYIFHMVLASILLKNRAAYLQAALATILLGGMSLSVYLNLLPHNHLGNVIPAEFCSQEQSYFFGKFSVLVITLFITVYISTTIANKLRDKEKELKEANAILEKQDKLKSEYVLTVSHDLKGPLSAIQSYLKVILSDLAGDVSEKAKEMISKAEKRCLSLIKFVDDLLNLSRIRASRSPKKENISLTVLVNEITRQLTPSIEKKQINLSVKGFKNKHNVLANQREMESVFVNLLVNAIKYTPSKNEIEINCKESKKANVVQISVSDTGIGIPVEDLPFIFNDFYRADNAKTLDKNGAGLGLSIVKHVINGMGCNIKVVSKVGKGTKFTFDLPLIK